VHVTDFYTHSHLPALEKKKAFFLSARDRELDLLFPATLELLRQVFQPTLYGSIVVWLGIFIRWTLYSATALKGQL